MKSIDQLLLEQAYEEVAKNEYWGTPKQPYWRPKANPTVDLVLIHN